MKKIEFVRKCNFKNTKHIPVKKQELEKWYYEDYCLEQLSCGFIYDVVRYMKIHTEKIYLKIFKVLERSDDFTLLDVKIPQTEKICRAAIKHYYGNIFYCDKQTIKLCNLAIKENIRATELGYYSYTDVLKYIKKPTLSMYKKIIQNHVQWLSYIKPDYKYYKQLATFALYANLDAIEYIDFKRYPDLYELYKQLLEEHILTNV